MFGAHRRTDGGNLQVVDDRRGLLGRLMGLRVVKRTGSKTQQHFPVSELVLARHHQHNFAGPVQPSRAIGRSPSRLPPQAPFRVPDHRPPLGIARGTTALLGRPGRNSGRSVAPPLVGQPEPAATGYQYGEIRNDRRNLADQGGTAGQVFKGVHTSTSELLAISAARPVHPPAIVCAPDAIGPHSRECVPAVQERKMAPATPERSRSANETKTTQRDCRHATPIATLVLPMPPGPVTVTNRHSSSSRPTLSTSISRPIRGVRGSGSPCRSAVSAALTMEGVRS